MESARKRKVHVFRKSSFVAFLSYESLAECFTKKKNKKNFTIMRRMTTAESTRAAGPLQQYVWLTLLIHISPRPSNTCIRGVLRPENDDFGLFCHELLHLPAQILDL